MQVQATTVPTLLLDCTVLCQRLHASEGRQRRSSSATWAKIAGLAVLVSAGGTARGQQILETYGRTLTAYSSDLETTVAQVWPVDRQRGVNLDGSLRSGSTQGWSLAGNPFGEGWNGNNRLADVRLDVGAYHPTDVDLALPAPGPRWVIGRTFNGAQSILGEHIDSFDAPQGVNWMQNSQPELAFASGSTDADDVLYIVYGADRYVEFQRTGTGVGLFKGKNGAAGVIKHTAGSAGPPAVPEKYEYYDQNGTVSTFFGSAHCGDAAWQLWKIVDPAGNASYVGDSSSMATAIGSYHSSGAGNPTGAILTAYDSADRRYTYAYATTVSSLKRLTQVKAETKTGGTWASPTGLATVGQVDYEYYTSTTNDVGKAPCLKMVTITTPLTDSGVNLVRKKHYRYYTRIWADSDGRRGGNYQLKMVVGFEGCRNFDWTGDATLDDDFLTASDTDLKPYAEAYFECKR